MANINWFPGHMAKTLRELKEQIQGCDCILELADARIPDSSRNPLLGSLASHKPRLLVLGRADLANAEQTTKWCKQLSTENLVVASANILNKPDVAMIARTLKQFNEARLAKAKLRGRISMPLRVLVAGVPNVGKSTLINGLLGRKSQQVSNKPGVTRRLNWLRAQGDFLLLDSPGVLWPKLDTHDLAAALAATGAIRDDILPLEDVALWLLGRLEKIAPSVLNERYGYNADLIVLPENDGMMMLDPEIALRHLVLVQLAHNTHCLKGGSEADTLTISKRLIADYRSLRLGRISLELANEY